MSVNSTEDALLEDIRVIDLSRMLAGPHSASILAELGADVVARSPADRPAPGLGEHTSEILREIDLWEPS